jgi:Domain of unknown function (DUF397)
MARECIVDYDKKPGDMKVPDTLIWTKSSLSFSNGNCVEVAHLPDGGVGVRNSRHSNGDVLVFTPAEWDAFLGGVRNGEFDRVGGPSASL